MATIKFYASSITFFLLLSFTASTFPGAMNDLTGLDTGEIQGTNVSSAPSGTGNISDAGSIGDSLNTILTIYTSANSQNRVLQAIFLIFTLIVARDIIDLGWIG